MMITDEQLNRYRTAARKYRPNRIKIIFVAESPPWFSQPEKQSYFYFENNPGRDILFASLMKAIYDVDYKKDPEKKTELLNNLMGNGYWLMDAVEYPINKDEKGAKRSDKERERFIRKELCNFRKRILGFKKESVIGEFTKFILIKETVFNTVKEALEKDKFEVINKKYIGFPRYYRDREFVAVIRNFIGC